MFKNFLVIAFRNLSRHKVFSIINIVGLATGIASCIIVCLFITDELSYDKQNKDASRIYRVVKNFVSADGISTPDANTPPAIAPAMQQEIPEIECIARLFPKPWGNNFYVRCGTKKFVEERIYHADSSIFSIFSFSFIKGNPCTALNRPEAIVLTESIAKKYFGNDDPIGKRIEVDDWNPCTVTAVIKDIPSNMHVSFDILVPLNRFMHESERPSPWDWYSFYTYIKLKPGTSIASVDKKIRNIFKKNQPESRNYFYSQPLTSIHLHSNLQSELKPGGDIIYIWIFGIVAFFILLIACINYINLTTATFSLRAKEIGIRKVAGAGRVSLLKQFFTESMLLVVIATLVAIGFTKIILPEINIITAKQLSVMSAGGHFIVYVFSIALITGLIAGLYPAVYLSSFHPAQVLKGKYATGKRNLGLRQILAIIQFSTSVIMITGTAVIVRQINFMQQTKLSPDKNHIIVVNDVGYLNNNEKTILKSKLMQVPGVKNIAAADGVPGGITWERSVRSSNSQSNLLIHFLSTDENIPDVLGIPVKAGHSFSPGLSTDSATEIILNETAVRELGIQAPFAGQQIVWNQDAHTGKKYYATITGVMPNFQFASMKDEITPFAFVANSRRQWNYLIKLNSENMSETIAALKKTWENNVLSRPFQYTFLDETYGRLYASEMSFRNVFAYLTFIAVFIACLGLFALSAFITEQRRKEVGIRKILGASLSGIAILLSTDIVKLIVIASAISCPLTWLMAHLWLRNFAYRVQVSGWIFVEATLASLFIAIFTISYHICRAAIANPVKSLRTE